MNTRYTLSGIDCSPLAKLPPSTRQAAVEFARKNCRGIATATQAHAVLTSALRRMIAADGAALVALKQDGLFVGCDEVRAGPDFARPILSLPLQPIVNEAASGSYMDANEARAWVRSEYRLGTDEEANFLLGRACTAGQVHFAKGSLTLGPKPLAKRKSWPKSANPKKAGRPVKVSPAKFARELAKSGGAVSRKNAPLLAASLGCSVSQIWRLSALQKLNALRGAKKEG